MILQGFGPSERFKQSHVDRLVQCDDWYGYSESGWYNIAGYKGESRTRVIHCHANSFEEVRSAFAWKGFGFDGRNVWKMSDEEKQKLRGADEVENPDGYGYPSYRRR